MPWRSRSAPCFGLLDCFAPLAMTGRDFPQLVLAASLNARRRPILPFILSLVVLGVLLYFMGWLPMGDAGKAGRWVRDNTTFLLFTGAALILSRSPGLAVLGMAVWPYPHAEDGLAIWRQY